MSRIIRRSARRVEGNVGAQRVLSGPYRRPEIALFVNPSENLRLCKSARSTGPPSQSSVRNLKTALRALGTIATFVNAGANDFGYEAFHRQTHTRMLAGQRGTRTGTAPNYILTVAIYARCRASCSFINALAVAIRVGKPPLGLFPCVSSCATRFPV